MSSLSPPPPSPRRLSLRPLLWLVVVGALAVVVYNRAAPVDVRVLFVGNSYTASNDMPNMAVRLAGSVGVRMAVSVIAPGGAWLADHLRSGSVAAALAGGDFDVVVFQEQSMAPADRRIARESTDPSASMLTQLARAAGARVVFFQTWGHVSGSQAVGHSSYESMQNAITATYDDLGSRHLGTVAPVGEAWRAYFISGHGLPLHGPDGSHPTVAGSYLAAAVIAATITGVDPTEFSWTGSLDDVSARTLLESAERALPTAP